MRSIFTYDCLHFVEIFYVYFFIWIGLSRKYAAGSNPSIIGLFRNSFKYLTDTIFFIEMFA